jgi:hypothetical protein
VSRGRIELTALLANARKRLLVELPKTLDLFGHEAQLGRKATASAKELQQKIQFFASRPKMRLGKITFDSVNYGLPSGLQEASLVCNELASTFTIPRGRCDST